MDKRRVKKEEYKSWFGKTDIDDSLSWKRYKENLKRWKRYTNSSKPQMAICPCCGNLLKPSDLDGYPYVCYRCDENFFMLEAIQIKI